MRIEDFLARLDNVTTCGKGWSARCPGHEDRAASLTVSSGDSGGIVLHCHAGCKWDHVVDAMGLEPRDLAPGEQAGAKDSGEDDIRTTAEIRSWPSTVATYEYVDELGRPLFLVVRQPKRDGKKGFPQYRSAGLGRWVKGLARDTRRVLYRLPEVLKGVKDGRAVMVAEGEKDVHSLVSLGYVATCNPGGAGKWRKEFAEALGEAHVVVFEDNDEAGRKHAERVVDSLKDVARSIRVVKFRELPEHSDVSDYLGSGASKEQLEQRIRSTPAWEVPAPEPVGDTPHLTDLGNAKRLVEQHGKNIRFCPALGWVVWDDRRWAPDETGEIVRLAKTTVLRLYDEAENPDLGARGREQLLKHAERSESAGKISAMIQLAQSEPGVPVLPYELDADPWVLNLGNGTLDLRSGELRAHAQADMITKLAPVSYDPKAQCPKWQAFLDRIMQGNEELIAFLRRAAGYSLTGSVAEEVFFTLHGTGRNGKGTFVETMAALLGEDFARKIPSDLLLEARKNGTGPSPEVARLKGVRFAHAAENEEGRKLAEAFVKEATGGDTLTARFLNANPFDFRPTHKLWYSTNHKPRIRGTDEGIWSRIHLVPFDVVIPEEERDKNLKVALRRELSGVLNWALAGCLEWQRVGLRPPAEVRHATESYRRESDVLAEFLEDACQVGHSVSDSARVLYASYVSWCEENGERAASQKTFGTALASKGFVKDRDPHTRRFRWRGLRALYRDDSRSSEQPPVEEYRFA